MKKTDVWIVLTDEMEREEDRGRERWKGLFYEEGGEWCKGQKHRDDEQGFEAWRLRLRPIVWLLSVG